ncbi:hypothetical protein HDU76_010725, partial [Blyttiomyces sp. JEL0837]
PSPSNSSHVFIMPSPTTSETSTLNSFGGHSMQRGRSFYLERGSSPPPPPTSTTAMWSPSTPFMVPNPLPPGIYQVPALPSFNHQQQQQQQQPNDIPLPVVQPPSTQAAPSHPRGMIRHSASATSLKVSVAGINNITSGGQASPNLNVVSPSLMAFQNVQAAINFLDELGKGRVLNGSPTSSSSSSQHSPLVHQQPQPQQQPPPSTTTHQSSPQQQQGQQHEQQNLLQQHIQQFTSPTTPCATRPPIGPRSTSVGVLLHAAPDRHVIDMRRSRSRDRPLSYQAPLNAPGMQHIVMPTTSTIMEEDIDEVACGASDHQIQQQQQQNKPPLPSSISSSTATGGGTKTIMSATNSESATATGTISSLSASSSSMTSSPKVMMASSSPINTNSTTIPQLPPLPPAIINPQPMIIQIQHQHERPMSPLQQQQQRLRKSRSTNFYDAANTSIIYTVAAASPHQAATFAEYMFPQLFQPSPSAPP